MIKKIIIIQALAYSLFAHDIWIDDSFIVHYGHINKSNSHGEEKEIKQEDILEVFCLRDSNIFEMKNKNDKSGCDALFVELNKAYYTKTPYGTLKQAKDEVKMSIKSFQSIESVKRVYNDNATELFKSGLELTLTNKLSEISVDDKARLLVSFNAKAQAGVVVAYDENVIGVSDENGHINVRIRKTGLQNIKASYTLKGDGVKCDEVIYTTTLNIKVLK
ncbi:MAG: hypothetical protein A2513_00460 [Sulfurimonas sp. RIFOXYD12_FULL_33_39]|uniref:hypothetical protein n=1 Tax=unclassified Sulfurimonas TaxID=2623549 RepID=UPI0008AF7A0D|nr:MULTISPECIES: hypothetical protein [unclassified Sulfurimonas]OHE10801.1 MAG: hypothetical protein A2513_00460 [Sulfurimonas sp. RIFOXYD12_FULL_33_39]OHE13429.1 MAG: hypothetical protein A2530_07720 [Sulfurimonas sp. RIFOXYD2_FULL_34_21]